MPRPSLQEVVASAAVLFADNTVKAITPAKLRQCVDELVAAIRPASGYLYQSPDAVKALTAVPSPPTYAIVSLSPIVDYTLNGALGSITRIEKGFTRIEFTCDVKGSENSNRLVTFALYKNGVVTPWRMSVTLSTSTLVESLAFSAVDYSSAGPTVYEIRVSSDVATSVTLSEMLFLATTQFVWQYT